MPGRTTRHSVRGLSCPESVVLLACDAHPGWVRPGTGSAARLEAARRPGDAWTPEEQPMSKVENDTLDVMVSAHADVDPAVQNRDVV